MADIFEKYGAPVELNQDGTVKKEEVQTDVEQPKEEPKEVPVEKEPEFSFETFKGYAKTKFEREIGSEDELKTYFEKASKADELETRVSELSGKLKEITDYAARNASGRDWFVSDDEFMRQQFLRTKSAELSEQAIKVLSPLSPEKIKKLDPVEAVKIGILVENPDINDEEVSALIEEEFGDLEDMSKATSAKLKLRASESKSKLESLYSGIELPKAVDFEAQKESLKTAWSKPMADLVAGITKVDVLPDFAFDVTPEMKQGLVEEAMSEVLSSYKSVSEEAAREVAAKVRDKLLLRNLDKIFKVREDDIREKARAEFRQSVHNDKPLNDSRRSVEDNTEAVDAKSYFKGL